MASNRGETTQGASRIRDETTRYRYDTSESSTSQYRARTTFKLEGEVTSLSESSQGEVGDFWEKLIAINQNIVS